MIQALRSILRWQLLLLGLLVLGGCASLPQTSVSGHIKDSGAAGRCAEFFQKLDQATVADGALDGGEVRIEGYPYLRVNRLLASYRREVKPGPRFNSWLDHLQALDRKARDHEIANLAATTWRDTLAARSRADLRRDVRRCGNRLRALDFRSPAQRQILRRRARVPDEYQRLPRILGLYPVSSLFISQGVNIWHAKARRSYSNTPPLSEHFKPYVYSGPRPSYANLQTLLGRTPRDALGFPMLEAGTRRALFAYYAPRWLVRQHTDDDRIGTPYWRGPGEPAVRVDQPRTYTRVSYTRFAGQLLTQLNYIIWFPARTRQQWLDIYAGPLDGVNLRITLDPHGDPLLYETMHNCGCYYKVYPGRQLKVRESNGYSEPPLILAAPILNPASQILNVAMGSASHYVEHLYPAPAIQAARGTPYALHGYAELLSLANGTGNRASLFDATGTVAASDRPERFILWPTGVYSPGAMRQWGRHAVAFVGERHFDDPDYMNRMFSLAGNRW